MMPRFHLAFPVDDLRAARAFYGGILGCSEGRSAATWVDFDFHGHQLVAHLVPPAARERGAPDAARERGSNDAARERGSNDAARERDSPDAALHRNAVDGDAVPVPHFGLVLDWDDWETLRDRLAAAGCAFEIAPHVRFAGQAGEQATMFLFDPAGNALEFKAFRDIGQMFAR